MHDNRLRDLISVAAGRQPADLVLKNAKIVNVVSHEIHEGDVAIAHGRIAGIGDYQGDQHIDLKGRYVCPGFMDAHVHIESSLLAVPEFCRVVLAHGTTTVVADPHEFANVMGTEGISYVLRTAKRGPVTVYVMLSSCVPASPLESAGAELHAEDLEPFLSNPWVLGLAELMNYPGVVAGQTEVLSKLSIAHDKTVDGHAPSLTGADLTAYAAAGIMSDHECTDVNEAADKIRCGMCIMVREGSQARNLEALLPLITLANADRFMFCTDDKDVRDLIEQGQIDHMIRKSIALGMDPVLAVRLATFNTARYFGLRQTGAILPGYRADIAVLDNLSDCNVTHVFRQGELVAESGDCLVSRAMQNGIAPLRSSINVHAMSPKDFVIPAPEGVTVDNPPRIHVIEVAENRIDTERSIDVAAVRDGQLVSDPARDLAKLVVVDRHRASGETACAFARGFKLEGGAIASSIAHDAHNLIAVGVNDTDIHMAFERLVELRGGLVVVRDGQVIGEVQLPIAGLVSDQPAGTVAEALKVIAQAARGLGCPFDQPFMALSFLSLSVIGKLKLTNQGLIDVDKFHAIPLVA